MSFLNTPLDVGTVNCVALCRAPHQLHFSISSDGKYAVNYTPIVDQAGTSTCIDGHCVSKMGHEKFEDWVGIWKVSHGSHCIGLHSSMAAVVVSANLMELQQSMHSCWNHDRFSSQSPPLPPSHPPLPLPLPLYTTTSMWSKMQSLEAAREGLYKEDNSFFF